MGERIAVFNIHKSSHMIPVDRDIILRNDLSIGSIGLYAYLQAIDDEEISEAELARRTNSTVVEINKYCEELKKIGYL